MSFWSWLSHLFGGSNNPPPAPVIVPQPTTRTYTVTAPAASGFVAVLIPDMAPVLSVNLVDTVATFILPASDSGTGAALTVSCDGYDPITVRLVLPLISGPLDVAFNKLTVPVAPQWTKAQLMDFQGDAVIWMPELKPIYVNGVDPATGMHQANARGFDAGWVWTSMLWFYSAENRQAIYAKIKSYGYTHVQHCIAEATPGPGYHNLRPVVAAECPALNVLAQVIFDELVAASLIPVCVGPAPGPSATGGSNVAPGFDVTKVQVVMSDWDNSFWAANRIKFLSNLFPNALIYFEIPNDPKQVWPQVNPSAPGDDPIVPTATNGGTWLAAITKLYPRFVGVFYELDGSCNVTNDAAELNLANGWWRDIQQVLGESDTYPKFWNANDMATQRAYNDQVRKACPFLHGYLSGGTSHAVIPDPTGTVVSGGTPGIDMIDPHSVTWVAGPQIGNWPITTALSSVDVRADGVECLFDKRDGPNRWPDTAPAGGVEPGTNMGGLEYSLGVCLNINGKWYGCAPIETWNGRNVIGGAIQSQTVNGLPPGQLPVNWFYDGRWAPMTGYQPKPGELIGLFVAAGDCRNNYSPVQERSNIVTFPLPAPNTVATFVWS